MEENFDYYDPIMAEIRQILWTSTSLQFCLCRIGSTSGLTVPRAISEFRASVSNRVFVQNLFF